MVQRKIKARRRKPRRKVRDSLVDSLRRAGLYGTALLLLWLGASYYRNLQTAADIADAPYNSLDVFKGELKPGSLRESLTESGSDASETKAVLRALRKVGSTGPVRSGDAFRVVRSTDGAFHHLTLIRGTQRVVVTSEEGEFRAQISKQPFTLVERSVTGKINGSLWLSMSRLGAPAEIILEYADVFQWAIDFLTESWNGDSFAVTWQEKRTPDGRVWGREISAARYDGEKVGRHTGILYEGYYYDEKGQSLRSIFLRAPLNFRRISSYFSRGRWHPVLRKRRPHHGIDYAAPRGTPVVSVGAGRVTAKGRRGGFGKRIEIKHNSVYSTLYGHLNGYAQGIQNGVHVRQGQVIGYVGSTGLATGPHLHFQISKHGHWVNFLRLKLPKTRRISVKDQKAFFAIRDRLEPKLSETPLAHNAGSGR